MNIYEYYIVIIYLITNTHKYIFLNTDQLMKARQSNQSAYQAKEEMSKKMGESKTNRVRTEYVRKYIHVFVKLLWMKFQF